MRASQALEKVETITHRTPTALQIRRKTTNRSDVDTSNKTKKVIEFYQLLSKHTEVHSKVILQFK